ncbi:MAG TPA: hypothetical protein VNT92_01230 [Acidimicrobiia bacterium]|nr:hypothetical protein [Acidimicrobiia bacterium]
MRRWLTLIVLLVAACGGGGAADPEATGTTEDSGTEGETMADFFGYGTEDPEAQEVEYREQEARIQESIRQCMAEAGFEYQPVMPPESSFMVTGEEWDEEEYVRTQGFGISTWYGNEESTTDTTMIEEEWFDPNQEMLEAMSESESTAWNEALWGTEEENMEDMVTEVDPETGEEMQVSYGYGGGCSGEAYEAEYGDMEQSQDLWSEVQPAMDAMYQQVQADPRIVELDQEWSACMAERGFEYESMTAMQESVYTDFQTRFDEIVGPNGGFADPFAGMTEEEINAFFEEKTEEEIDAFYAAAEEESQQNVDMEALAALQQEEIDLAVADFECRGDYWEVYQEVSEEYEVDFIAENREALERIREAEQGG